MMNMIITTIIIMTMRVAAVTIRIGSVQNFSTEKFFWNISKVLQSKLFEQKTRFNYDLCLVRVEPMDLNGYTSDIVCLPEQGSWLST